ncbi:hypothetical protein RchiOBHm_Chr4g0441551 [Rosa chinensis]|uniref:Uncharacterized protein n=1 Tax=Rosa chinensis TaxID=74649 RepID=A0A2P6R3B9_ROSCH|nr:hypothetical protein RchiOBHm_Chr4g0441551 [Rosa chinensis]
MGAEFRESRVGKDLERAIIMGKPQEKKRRRSRLLCSCGYKSDFDCLSPPHSTYKVKLWEIHVAERTDDFG